MKFLARILLLAVLACSLPACLLREPVFTEGFAKADDSLGGVWENEPDEGDSRKVEFAVCAPLDDTRQMVNYPAGGKDGLYYEVRSLAVRGRTVLQLRAIASFSDGVPKPGSEVYTLLWIEKEDGGKKLRIRALGGEAVKDRTPAQLRKALETQSTDWTKLFGPSTVFRRLKDR